MRTTTRRQFMAASGTAALLGAAGCSSGDTRGDDSGAGAGSATGEVEFWAWQAGLDTIVAEFNASQSDITVNYNVIPSGADAYKKIESAVKSGTGPDLAQVEAQQIPTFAVSGGVLMDVAAEAEQYKQNYSAPTWSSAGFQGQQYGIPNDQGPLVTYVNDDILTGAGAEFGGTWEEYRDLASKVRTDTDAYLGTLITGGAFMAAVSWQNNATWFSIEDESSRSTEKRPVRRSTSGSVWRTTTSLRSTRASTPGSGKRWTRARWQASRPASGATAA